MIYLVIVPT